MFWLGSSSTDRLRNERMKIGGKIGGKIERPRHVFLYRVLAQRSIESMIEHSYKWILWNCALSRTKTLERPTEMLWQGTSVKGILTRSNSNIRIFVSNRGFVKP